ncbi:zinc ribbon domain-containing protein [Sulfurospirillum arcachonense]|uniref:zinc ribbon domain-containing protein n=1 Tax=Sulfurospirillum arcachonense TaxID=57666 RepID=UPI000469E00E|nr:zinc ribbon domain-containing protein [Sulfurospirillum arcachonense]
MNKYLEQLVNLSKIDKEIDAFGPRVKEIESKLRAAVAKENDISKTILAYEEEVKDCKLKRSKNELHLAELSDKLTEISKKGAIVKTDKEIKALQLEEEISKEQCEFANEEIERLDSIIEAKDIDIEEKKEELAQIQKNTEEIRTSIESQMSEIEKERSTVYSSKEKLISEMSQKILTFYEKIRKWAGNTTVVPVKKQACYGCFMRINDKTYASVIAHDDIVTCPHCGRILYKELEEVEA